MKRAEILILLGILFAGTAISAEKGEKPSPEDLKKLGKAICKQDLEAHCAGLTPGKGLMKCVRRNIAAFSEPCASFLKKHRKEIRGKRAS